MYLIGFGVRCSNELRVPSRFDVRAGRLRECVHVRWELRVWVVGGDLSLDQSYEVNNAHYAVRTEWIG